jgi:formamidopyrimidine-DNA glycosylase
VAEVVVTDQDILRDVTASELDKALRGHRFEEPDRRGKWVIAWTDGPALMMHFGMTGDISWSADAAYRHAHDRVIVVLDRGEVRYRNMRKFGGVWLAATRDEVDALLSRLGPDALRVGRQEFLERMRRRRGQVKVALLDQSFIAGIGNLLADETLWNARIHPTRPIESLSNEERAALFRALRSVIRRTMEEYPGGFRIRWNSVDGHPVTRCPRCRTDLRRIVVGGRGTYLCPSCQTR